MKIQNQVCTLAQSQRLHELGIAQGFAAFSHVYPHMNSGWKILADGMWDLSDDEIEWYDAFNVAELCVMLPVEVPNCFDCYSLSRDEYTDGTSYYTCSYRVNPSFFSESIRTDSGNSMAEAMADMLIYLLEKGHTTAEECSSRLLNS